MATSPYTELPATGPYDVAIGTSLITMVEPHEGHDEVYNRWYEDDHFFSGAMAMPWICSGVVPQQPPIRDAPASAISRAFEAKYSGVAR